MKSQFEMELSLYLTYILKPFIAIKYLFATPKGLSIAIPTMASVAIISNETRAWYFLFVVFGIDFITGIAASYYLNFKENGKTEEYFNILKLKGFKKELYLFFYKLRYFIDNVSSEKLRKSIVKAVGYTFFILGSYFIQNIFGIKTWEFETISHLTWSLTLFAQAICIGIEIWSILFENFKKLGFDIVKVFRQVIGTYKEIKKEIKEDS